MRISVDPMPVPEIESTVADAAEGQVPSTR